ncbi:MAG: aminopeptidase [Clostridia bacterium]|nr:aminopeptidase [Clostridia bacterium]
MELNYTKKDVYSGLSEKEVEKATQYTDGYMKFITTAKTEYLCVEEAIKMLEENSFQKIEDVKTLKAGDKVYFVNREKSVFAATIGKENLSLGMNIIGAHIDSPRLDLKPFPLTERDNIALLKTQYYGGIKKYHWLSIPLAMHGVVYNEKNEKVVISVGEDKNDPVFTIADLLPHLAKEQLKANAEKFINPEKMSVIVGNTKDKEVKENPVKANILKILNQKYGIKEIDFARSEISLVPAFEARYIGFDKALIGGYGQDDRVCSYATLKALIETSKKVQNKTNIALIVDKEEIGSIGNTSMNSRAFDLFVLKLIEKTGSKNLSELEVYYNSKMLSADVTAGVNPDYEEVQDMQNASIIGSGVSVEKYGGSGGKYNSSDANARYVAEVMSIFDKNKVGYQVGTLGKVEMGGGGTIAYILANKGVEVVDCGTPVLAMHSTFEVTSKFDVYMTYMAYKAFFEN